MKSSLLLDPFLSPSWHYSETDAGDVTLDTLDIADLCPLNLTIEYYLVENFKYVLVIASTRWIMVSCSSNLKPQTAHFLSIEI